MPGIARILVPTDFSPASDLALQYAIDLADRLRCRIDLLHVVDDVTIPTLYPGSDVEVPALREQVMSEASAQLTKVLDRCVAAGVMTTAHVQFGTPARVIADTAENRGTDLIVMGTHGRGAIAHLLVGSVAERVVRIAPCAVLTVRDTARIADVLADERVAMHASAQPA
jgi:nucleotide-binding universal stress UspA family protein